MGSGRPQQLADDDSCEEGLNRCQALERSSGSWLSGALGARRPKRMWPALATSTGSPAGVMRGASGSRRWSCPAAHWCESAPRAARSMCSPRCWAGLSCYQPGLTPRRGAPVLVQLTMLRDLVCHRHAWAAVHSQGHKCDWSTTDCLSAADGYIGKSEQRTRRWLRCCCGSSSVASGRSGPRQDSCDYQ